MATPKSTLTNDQKRNWAQTLYTKERLSQKEIAAKVGVSEKTISTWKEKHNWEALRKSLLVTKDEQLRRLYNQLDALTADIEAREESPWPNSKEADTQMKITASIEKMETETSIAEIVDVGRKFLEFVRKDDLDMAQKITGFYDAFIQNNLR